MKNIEKCIKKRRRIRNKFRHIIFSLLLIYLLFSNAFTLKAYSEDVAVIVSGDLSVYRLALEGFQNKCRYSFKEYFLDNEKGGISRVVSQIKSINPKLIYTLGVNAAKVAKENFRRIPIVFSLVANPYRYGLSGENIYGVRLDVSPLSQLNFLKKISPDSKKIGILYDPGRTQEIIDEINMEAGNFGMKVVDMKVKSRRQVADAIRNLEGKIDIFWLITDPVVANSVVFERLLLFTLSNRIPLVCPARAFVNRGGLLSLDVDFKDLGSQSAQLVNKILSATQIPDEDRIQWPDKVKLILNLKVANTIGLSVPQSVIDEVDEVVQDNHNK